MKMMARKPMGRWRFRADPLGRTAPASEQTPDCGFPERTPYSGVEGEDLIGRVIRTTRRCTRPPSRRPPDRTARWSSETGRRCSRAGRRRRRRPRRAGSSTAVAETSSAPRPHVRDTLSRVVELLADGRPLPASHVEDKVWEDAADTSGFPFVHSIARSDIGRCGPATVSHDGGLRKSQHEQASSIAFYATGRFTACCRMSSCCRQRGQAEPSAAPGRWPGQGGPARFANAVIGWPASA